PRRADPHPAGHATRRRARHRLRPGHQGPAHPARRAAPRPRATARRPGPRGRAGRPRPGAAATRPHRRHRPVPPPRPGDPTMTPPADPATRLAQEAARRGCTVEQLLDRLAGLPRLETVAGFLPHYLAGLSPDTAKRYATPLLMVRDGWSVPPEHVDLVVDL